MSSSELLRVEGLSAAWNGVPVLTEVSLVIASKEFLVLMGPNGSGKTTLLRCLAGLEDPVAGRIWLEGRRLDGLPPHRRGVGMLFQEPALFPNRSVWENIAYGLWIQRFPVPEIDRRVEELLHLLHLGHLVDRSPETLSGGERQRVALARSLAPRPKLLLLDEPFASVDPMLRTELRSEFRAVLRALDVAILHVTHDREEGLFLGDRVLLIDSGRILQAGSPRELFDHPQTVAAARFLGYDLLWAGNRWVAVHPRDLRIGPPEGPGTPAEVLTAGSGGTETIVHLRTEDGDPVEVRASPSGVVPAPGTRVRLSWSRSREVAPVGDARE